MIEQPGRLLADGTRVGGRTARKATFYLDLDVATRLKEHAARQGKAASDIVNELLRDALVEGSSIEAKNKRALASLGAVTQAARGAGVL